MAGRWARYLLWGPFEAGCRKTPLVPLRACVTEPVEGVVLIRIDNIVTKALSAFGGYDYSVCYLVDGSLLIDTGFPWARRALRQVLLDRGADRTLRVVVNTHYHEDHVGNNDLVAELTPARLYAHPLALPEIRYPSETAFYRRFLFGPTPCTEVLPAPARLRTENHHFELLHLPGHCPGHLCLFEPEKRWLFSGDLYIAADLDSQLGDADGPAWIASLDQAIALRPACLFDAHGLVLTGEEAVRELLVRKREFLVELRRRVLEAAVGALSVREITRRVFQKRDWVDCLSFSDGWLSLITGSDFSRGNVVKSFLREQCVPTGAERTAAPSHPAGYE